MQTVSDAVREINMWAEDNLPVEESNFNGIEDVSEWVEQATEHLDGIGTNCNEV